MHYYYYYYFENVHSLLTENRKKCLIQNKIIFIFRFSYENEWKMNLELNYYNNFFDLCSVTEFGSARCTIVVRAGWLSHII